MKAVKILVAASTVVILLLTAAISARNNSPEKVKAIRGSGFAVLELFTSEGCSSCPPADELIAKIQQEAANKPVYILAYHVDYWNRLGWKDVFSKPEFSERQYFYSKALNAQVYTPQLVINGKAEFIGSDEGIVTNAVNEALKGTSAISLNLQGMREVDNLVIDPKTAGDTKNAQLLIAFVKKRAVTEIKRGENAGRSLAHVQIVDRFVSFKIPSSKSLVTKLPEAFNSSEWEILGLLQNVQTGAIYAASRLDLNGI